MIAGARSASNRSITKKNLVCDSMDRDTDVCEYLWGNIDFAMAYVL